MKDKLVTSKNINIFREYISRYWIRKGTFGAYHQFGGNGHHVLIGGDIIKCHRSSNTRIGISRRPFYLLKIRAVLTQPILKYDDVFIAWGTHTSLGELISVKVVRMEHSS